MLIITLSEVGHSFLEVTGVAALVIYCVSLMAITIYCLLQFHLLFYYKLRKGKYVADIKALKSGDDALPMVTIQLPIFNERYVVKRLLESITSLDYPKELMEIQLLDDSTDDTVDISAEEVMKYQAQGFDIKHVRRENRQGYKAGALKEATEDAKGEFIAIFDADFLPKADFLRKTLSHFENEKVGIVQTRWEHLNQDYSLLTKVQALQLNVHFTVEQLGRKVGNLLLQFNGTAGVWRKETIRSPPLLSYLQR